MKAVRNSTIAAYKLTLFAVGGFVLLTCASVAAHAVTDIKSFESAVEAAKAAAEKCRRDASVETFMNDCKDQFAALEKAESALNQAKAQAATDTNHTKPGGSISDSPKVTDTSKANQVGGPYDGYERDHGFKLKDDGDRCGRSSVANKEWGCDDTHSLVDTSRVMH